MIKTYITSIAIHLVIACAAPLTFGQNGAGHVEQAPPNVEILSQKWSKIAVLQGPDRRGRPVFDPSNSMPQTRESRTSRSTRYVYELKVRNTGDKSLRAITWDYIFTDAVTKKEIDRRRFYSGVTIHPHKTKTLEGYTRSAPTSTISASGGPSERVVIECVVLEDGSTWRQPSYRGSCGDRK